MARKFLYVSLGILALAIACNLGSGGAGASIVDTSIAGGNVVAAATEGNAFSLLTADGSIYWVTEAGFTFVRSIPIPVADVAFFLGDDEGIVSRSGEVWKVFGAGWLNLGPAPGGPIPVANDSFGAIKGKFRR